MGNQSKFRVHDITSSYGHIYNLKQVLLTELDPSASALRREGVLRCAGGSAYLASSLDSQSSPSYRPVPWVAHAAWMCH